MLIHIITLIAAFCLGYTAGWVLHGIPHHADNGDNFEGIDINGKQKMPPTIIDEAGRDWSDFNSRLKKGPPPPPNPPPNRVTINLTTSEKRGDYDFTIF